MRLTEEERVALMLKMTGDKTLGETITLIERAVLEKVQDRLKSLLPGSGDTFVSGQVAWRFLDEVASALNRTAAQEGEDE